MTILRTHAKGIGRSPIPPERVQAIAGKQSPSSFLDQSLWAADLHGLGIGHLRGEAVFDQLMRHFGSAPEHVGEMTVVERAWLARLTGDEFLLMTRAAEAIESTLRSLTQKASDRLMSAADTTHGNSILGVGGPEAAKCLGKLTGLDLRQRAFPNPRVAQTSLAKVHATLMRHDIEGIPAYVVLVGRSVGAYLWDVLVDVSSREGLISSDGDDLRERWFAP